MQRLALSLTALVCLAGSAAAEPVDAKKLIGVWEIIKISGRAVAAEDGGTMLLSDDGTLSVSPGGLKGAVLEGTYTVDGDKITVRLKALGGGELSTTSTVKRLTRDTLLLIQPGAQEVEYRRKTK